MNNLKANKLHIGIFGKRNSGKSSLMNRILGQDFSIVSNVLGTTTDVNQKTMELLPIGSVVFLDTAGIDDTDELLGQKRIEKTLKVLNRTDVAIYVCDFEDIKNEEEDFLKLLKTRKIPTLVVINKKDLGQMSGNSLNKIKKYFEEIVFVSIKNDPNSRKEIKEGLINVLPKEIVAPTDALGEIIKEGETAILVIPIDKEAPKDRIILPQVQIIRNILDKKAICNVCQTENLKDTISNLKMPPKIVITDSQAFKEVAEIVPSDIYLTSFSILFARLKGNLKTFIKGADRIDYLEEGDTILICESCTHHPIEDDIGRVKLPNWLKKYTGKNLNFETYSGYDFPFENLEKYALVIHCGACMTNRREILTRILKAEDKNVPITNYGIAISKCLGILPRAIEIFKNYD